MVETKLSRRGFLGHLGGAAATAVVVTAPIITAEERRAKAETDLIAALLELNPGGKVQHIRDGKMSFVIVGK